MYLKLTSKAAHHSSGTVIPLPFIFLLSSSPSFHSRSNGVALIVCVENRELILWSCYINIVLLFLVGVGVGHIQYVYLYMCVYSVFMVRVVLVCDESRLVVECDVFFTC